MNFTFMLQQVKQLARLGKMIKVLWEFTSDAPVKKLELGEFTMTVTKTDTGEIDLEVKGIRFLDIMSELLFLNSPDSHKVGKEKLKYVQTTEIGGHRDMLLRLPGRMAMPTRLNNNSSTNSVHRNASSGDSR